MSWVRVHGQGAHEQAIVVHVSHIGPVEVTLHQRTTPSSPKIDNSHFPSQAAGALGRQPKARNGAEANWSVSQSGPYEYENLVTWLRHPGQRTPSLVARAPYRTCVDSLGRAWRPVQERTSVLAADAGPREGGNDERSEVGSVVDIYRCTLLLARPYCCTLLHRDGPRRRPVTCEDVSRGDRI